MIFKGFSRRSKRLDAFSRNTLNQIAEPILHNDSNEQMYAISRNATFTKEQELEELRKLEKAAKKSQDNPVNHR